ncbi:MAG: leucine/isoleucine/valine transporter permease subunit [Proteobacteria bacterium]|nr:leucine/isoleucine/valine transporter permease subunit [Pseudomonadota bacterium]
MNSAVKTTKRAGIDFGRALKDGVIVGIVAFALLGPLVGLKTDQNMANELILQNRLGLAAILSVIVGVGRFLLSAFIYPRIAARGNRSKAAATLAELEARAKVTRRLSVTGLIFLFVYPVLIISLFGVQGSIKWVDNYGVQILIYRRLLLFAARHQLSPELLGAVADRRHARRLLGHHSRLSGAAAAR